MACEVKWLDAEHTILVATIEKSTTWSDYHSAIDEIIAQAAAVGHRVDIIFFDDVGMPAGNPLPHLRSGINKLVKQPNISMSVIAGSKGSNGFVRVIMDTLGRSFMAQVMTRVVETPLVFIRTLDEAIACIHKDRAKIKAISAD